MSPEQTSAISMYRICQITLAELKLAEQQIKKEKATCMKMINEVKQLHYLKGWEFPR